MLIISHTYFHLGQRAWFTPSMGIPFFNVNVAMEKMVRNNASKLRIRKHHKWLARACGWKTGIVDMVKDIRMSEHSNVLEDIASNVCGAFIQGKCIQGRRFKTTRAERVYGREKRGFFGSLHGRRDAPAWAEADSKKSRLEIPSPGAGASVAGRSPAS